MRTRLLALTLVLFATVAAGQTRYVSDQLVITLRSGPSTSNSILESLVSGDSVEILETVEDSGYSRVRAESGTEGWVLSQYLADRPVAADRLVIAERDNAEAEVQIATLEGSLAATTAELEVSTRRLAEAEQANSTLTADLSDIRGVSENVLGIREQNESLRRRLNERDEQVDMLSIQNAQLESRATRDWFIAGAGVLIAGILLGLIAPRIRRPRRRSEW
jgi:SH3 domain protein